MAGHVATTGETLNIADAYHDERFNRYAVETNADGFLVGSLVTSMNLLKIKFSWQAHR